MIAFLLVFFLLVGLAINWFVQTIRGTKNQGQDVVFENAGQPWFAAVLALEVVVFQVALYGVLQSSLPPVTGFAVWSAASILQWLLVLRRRLLHPFPLVLLLSIGSASCGLWWRANGFVQSVNVVAIVLSQVLLYCYAIWPQFPYTGTDVTKLLGRLTPRWFNQLTGILQALAGLGKHRSVAFGWMKTIFLTLLVIFIFIVLLSQADPVFAQVIKQFREEIFGRSLWAFLTIVITTMFFTLPKDTTEPAPTQLRWLSTRDLLVIMSSLAVLFGVFLAIQFQYLFGGSRELLVQLNLTYSEYVRKGFIELLWTVFFGSVLVYLAGLRVRTESSSAKWSWMLQVVSLIGVLELGLLLLSAWRRDVLYMDTYGLTRVRIVGELFLAWLAVNVVIQGVFVGVRWTKERMVFVGALLSSVVLVLLLNGLNVDSRIMATVPGHFDYTDYFYLANLSADAGPAQYQALLDKMRPELERLLAKTTLDEKEKYQLAGIKLALMALREHRNILLSRYAPEAWLLENDYRIGRTYEKPFDPEKMRAGLPYTMGDNLGRLPFASSFSASASASTQKELPRPLVKIRGWQYHNRSDAQLAEYLLNQPTEKFSELDQLLFNIRIQQVAHQWSLREEENKLLYVLQYPFISIHFPNYYPEELHDVSYDYDGLKSVDMNGAVAPASAPYLSTADPIVESLEQSAEADWMRLATNPCQPPTSMVVYGLLEESGQAEKAAAETTKYDLLRLTSHPRVAVVVNRANADNSNTLDTRPLLQSTIGTKHWGQAELQLLSVSPINTVTNSCTPVYNLAGWRELKVL